MVLAPVVRGRKGEYGKLLEELRAEGFARVQVDGEIRLLDEAIDLDKKYKHDIEVVVDRLVDAARRRASAWPTRSRPPSRLADGLVGRGARGRGARC